ncbi:uncharacterized protein Z519_06878 [Cladophialophora bantiana CBS 173.52]|uniref:Inhibitor I9 domain-containing protein n=1 Tax=Cladophialophora bantiana (strain ATCC 10958 / CBS 173.52 / CDC B-1940 / NIH 8579) TaxID=1442370 RepID=A0A0D2I8A2_CLAB1|nr:uncharacterized protein Z519_06878 [Cladophialophora bantiana CBS 173.52]KIW93029.1 hypothetical protein Z519_06878 [Cladophialophora bantiana CBS 173.52]
MRLPILFLLAFVAAVFALPPPQKPVVVSFPANTPSSIIDKAIAEIEKDGGIITHEYSLIKGFAAKVSEVTLDKISALAEAYSPYIEDDYVVNIDGSTSSAQ